ncbi:glycerate kinase [Collinsella sp. OM06-18AC]|uniref:tRNA adenosine(34) deaminase TadA n=1 Tax=Collinsella sp. OM06-18AC TaxID=2292327 RepID=UPI000E433ECA|nr:tRNA adenosine(34) deaminase TadA [Collinsella sp. OM06-18AC]RGM92877.1 glycerate kinase [Collinsella sp. OM06-18AC]
MTSTEIDEKFMREALAEARAAAAVGEVPIGAVVVRAGEIVARAHNRRELDQDPSAHAEFAALCAAARSLGRWRLSDCTVYVTLEPCCMCAGLMVNARVGRCVYGAADAKAGALGSLYDLNADSRLNHRFNVTAGVLADECREVLSSYFSRLRGTDGAGCGCGADLEAHAAHAAALAGVGEDTDTAVDFGPACRRPRRVLLAIDSFKGSVSSAQAEAAVAEGVCRVWPDAELNALPLADGGEGTLDAVAACGGEIVTCEVAGPLGKRTSARMLVDVERESAVIEMAEAAGIGYSPCTESSALVATTYGVGELMLRAVRAGAKTIYIGLGGSATNDGGAGMLQALGAHLVDECGRNISPSLAGLEHVASIDLAPALRALHGARIVVLSDVENPLVGRRGALAVFGGQKGLPTGDAEVLRRYDGWMVSYGRLLDAAIAKARAQDLLRAPEGARAFGSVLGVPGAGAAGGLGAALLALGAELRSGVETVLGLVGFDERVRDVDLVITGEGNMDEQSAAGKAPVGVARRAKRYGKPVVAVVGGRADSLDAVYGQGIDLVLPVCRKPMSLEAALDPHEAKTNLICAGESVARAYDLGRI